MVEVVCDDCSPLLLTLFSESPDISVETMPFVLLLPKSLSYWLLLFVYFV